MKKQTEPVTSAAWAPDGQTFFTGSLSLTSPLCIWPLQASGDAMPLFDFGDSCSRVQDCAIASIKRSPSSLFVEETMMDDASAPVRLVAICSDQSIHVYDYLRREKLSYISMDDEITCLNLSRDGREMLMNLSCGEIWAVRVEDGEVTQKFAGQKQGRFVIRGCYGGANEGFILSGGEGIPACCCFVLSSRLTDIFADSKITIWHRHSGRIIEQFAAHESGCVNTVTWNAALSNMFASAGDDHKVRMYVPLDMSLRRTADI